MTPRERAAYNAGIAQMRTMATIAAVTLENRPNTDDLRHRAAAAALHGLAEGARALIPFKPDPIAVALRIITDETGSSGIITCPVCAGRFAWSRDPGNCHVHDYGPVMFDLPDIVTANDVRTATSAIVRAVAAGPSCPTRLVRFRA